MGDLKLYVKIGDDFKPISGILAGSNLKPLLKIEIKVATDKYIDLCTSQKSIKNQKIEVLYFAIMADFFKSKGLIYIDEIRSEHIRGFENLLLKRMKATSVNRRFNTFKNFFNKLVEWEHIYKSPCHGQKKRKEEANQRKPWTYEVFCKFIKLCEGVEKDIFQFLWLTGCRPIEAKNLKWTDINYDKKVITVRCGKNAEISRNFPITKELDVFFHNLKFDSNFVFSKNKKQINNDTLYQYCKKRLISLGLNEYTVYGIRHGFGTKLAQAGVSSFYIAELMGHRKLETTRIYVHAVNNQLIDALLLVK